MELKYVIAEHDDEFQVSFNRTAYGIEICTIRRTTGITVLLIAPLMELKYSSCLCFACRCCSFNRTAYGIEIGSIPGWEQITNYF